MAFIFAVRYNVVMIAWEMLVWWYTDGWRRHLVALVDRVDTLVDYFSIGLLLKTLFAPFRQISAGQVEGAIDVQVRAFFDRLISRVIGAVVRLGMIVIGSVTIGLGFLADGLFLVIWAFVPMFPFVGLILFILEWIPWSR